MKLFKGVFFLRIILFVLLFPVQQSSGQSGLIGCYPLDNNATDFSGNNYNGASFNVTPIYDRFGNPNSAYHFSGSSSYVQIPATGYLLNEFTYSVWCKPTSLPNAALRGYYAIIAIGGVASDQMILLGNDNQSGFIGFGGGSWSSTGQPHQCYVSSLPSINQWYHLAVTRNNTQLSFYVNGILICASNYANVTAGYSGSSFGGSIGSREVSNVQNFVGDIDDVRIFNRVLTQTEIQNMSAPCGCILAIHLGADTSVCSGSNLILNTGNPGSSYAWYLNGSIIPNATAQTFQPQQSGQYMATVNGSLCSASDTINVTIHSLPVVTASPDVVICNGTTSTLTASGATFYQWSPSGSLNSSSGSSVSASPSSTTAYTVIGTDINNCSSQTSVIVTVNQIPAIVVSPGAAICQGDMVTLTASGGNSYSWSPPAGLDTTSGASVVAAPSGTTTYTVTGTDFNTCHNIASVMVSVNSLPSVQVTPGGTLSICGNKSVTLSANLAAGYQYLWYHDTTLINLATASQFIANSIGNYWVHVTDSNGCSANSQQVMITASSAGPVVTITSSPTIGCEPNTIYVGYGPQSVTLTANATGAASYLWSTGATVPSITISNAGLYFVTAWDTSGCSSQQTLQSQYSITYIDIRCGNDSRKIFLCHVSPGNTSNAQTVCISPNAVSAHLANHPEDCLGPCHPRNSISSEEESKNIRIYPNPFSNTFFLFRIFDVQVPMTIIIYDVTGRIVESHSEISVDRKYGNLLLSGIYSVVLISDNEKHVFKIIKL